jgi:hypothetical protein
MTDQPPPHRHNELPSEPMNPTLSITGRERTLKMARTASRIEPGEIEDVRECASLCARTQAKHISTMPEFEAGQLAETNPVPGA